MTRISPWSLFIAILLVVAAVMIYKYVKRDVESTEEGGVPFKWGLAPTTVEPFDMCFTVGEEGGVPVLAPCRGEATVDDGDQVQLDMSSTTQRADVLSQTGSAARAAEQLAAAGAGEWASGVQSETSALGETGALDGVEVSGYGSRGLNDGDGGIGELTGEGGGALWENRRGGEVGSDDIAGLCGETEYTVGDMCCAKHLLPKDAVYSESATSCLDWSCTSGYVKGASMVRCVRAGTTSADIIPGATPSLDTVGIIEGQATPSDVVTVRVESGSNAQLGDGVVTITHKDSGDSISAGGRKKSDRVFDFGPFNLTEMGGGTYSATVPFNVIAPRAEKTLDVSFSYCNPATHSYDPATNTCDPSGSCTGYFVAGSEGAFGACEDFSDCSGNAPIRIEGSRETGDHTCCPAPDAANQWTYSGATSAVDASCVQTCGTGALVLGMCPNQAPTVPTDCSLGKVLDPAVGTSGQRWFTSADTTVYSATGAGVDTSDGANPACTACTDELPTGAAWTEGCEWECPGATYNENGACSAYTAAAGCVGVDGRVQRLTGGDVSCCAPLGVGEQWVVSIDHGYMKDISLNNTGTMGKYSTSYAQTACSTKCQDGHYSLDDVCTPYTAEGQDGIGCGVSTDNSVTYKRVQQLNNDDVSCCAAPGEGKKWEKSGDFWEGKPPSQVIELNHDGTKKGVTGVCGTTCQPGHWSDGTECPSYTDWTQGAAFNCPVWDASTNTYRMWGGSTTSDVSCCDGLGTNEIWLYGPEAGDTVAKVRSDPGTADLNTVPTSSRVDVDYGRAAEVSTTGDSNNIGCQRVCESGFFRDASGDCVPRGTGAEGNCASQISEGEPYLRLSSRFHGREGEQLQCCAPLVDGEKWKQSAVFDNPATQNDWTRSVGDVSFNDGNASYAWWYGSNYGIYLGPESSRWTGMTYTPCERDCSDGWHRTNTSNTDPSCVQDVDSAACPGGRAYLKWDGTAGKSIPACCPDTPLSPLTYGTDWRWSQSDTVSRTNQNLYCATTERPKNGVWPGGDVSANLGYASLWTCTPAANYYRSGSACAKTRKCGARGGVNTAQGASNDEDATFKEPGDTTDRICCPLLPTGGANDNLRYVADVSACKLECSGNFVLNFSSDGTPTCLPIGELNAQGNCVGTETQSKLDGTPWDSDAARRYATLGDATYSTSGAVTMQQAQRTMKAHGYVWNGWAWVWTAGGGATISTSSTSGWNPYAPGVDGAAPTISPFATGYQECEACPTGVTASDRVKTSVDVDGAENDEWKWRCDVSCPDGRYQPAGAAGCADCADAGVYPSFNAVSSTFPSDCRREGSGRFLVLGMIEHDATSAGFNFLPVNTMLAPWDLVMKISMQQGDGVLAWTRSNGQRLPDDTAVPRNGTYARLMSGSGVKAISTQKYMQSNWWNRTFAMGACYESTASTTRGSIVFGNVYRRWLHTSGNGQVPFAPGGVNSALDQWDFGPAEMTDTDITTNDARVDQAAKHAWVITYMDGDGDFNPVDGLPRLYKDNKKRGGALTAAWQWVVGTTFVMGVDNPIVSSATPGTDLARWSQAVDTNGAWGFPKGYYLPTDGWVTGQNTTCPDGATCTVQSDGGGGRPISSGKETAGPERGWVGMAAVNACAEKEWGRMFSRVAQALRNNTALLA